MKKIMCLILTLAIASFFVVSCSKPADLDLADESNQQKNETKYYNIGASPATASMYPYWVAVGKAIQTIYPEYQITVSESRGATDVSNRVRAEDVVLGNCVARSDYENFHGLGEFDGDPNPNARILWYYDVTYYAFCVSKESGITSFDQLDGKRINTGGTGSTLVVITTDMMEDLGIKPSYYDSSKPDAGDAYANRQIVGMCSAAAIPDSFVLQLNANLPIEILSMTDEQYGKVTKDRPYYTKGLIPTGTYDGVDHDVHTIAYMQGGQSTSDLPQEDGYKFVKAVFEDGKDIWASTMPTAAKQNPIELALKSPIPLHAGMVQYIKEKGIDVPAHLIPPEYVEK